MNQRAELRGPIEDVPLKGLLGLLGKIQEKELALPDFQRDFVWEPGATQELIVSIASNYPAGALLAIRNKGNLFPPREFAGAPKLNGSVPTYLVLDGQQRLTSLYQALHGEGEYKYFMDLKKLSKSEDIEESIFYVRADARRGTQARQLKKYSSFEGQKEDLVLPLAELLGGKGFMGWQRQIERSLSNPTELKEIQDQLDKAYSNWIRPIEDYKIPMIVLADHTGADAVCTIFETLNRTGIKLSVFDLLTAKFWTQKVRLRELWEQALEDHPIIEEFEVDPYYILQSIALLSTARAPSCKRKDVLDLDADTVSKNWGNVIEGLALGLKILRDDCGVLVPKWLPYTTMVVPLAAIIAHFPSKQGLGAGMARLNLVKWFWCSVYGQTYEVAPNSVSARDFQQISTWLSGGVMPEAIKEFKFDFDILDEVTPKQRALYRGSMSLILANSPRDFHSGKPLTRSVIEESRVDDHHIFPDAWLKKRGVEPSRNRDCVLNRTLIDAATNQSLNKRGPGDYFAEIKKALGDAKFAEILKSHLLPSDPNGPLLKDDFDSFKASRKEQLKHLIEHATS
jgi:hypothetical protein